MSDFLQTVRERVVIYDGAMGTSIMQRNLSLDDFWNKEGCSEVLALSKPEVIRAIHVDFLKAGCDVVETNTFVVTNNHFQGKAVANALQIIHLLTGKQVDAPGALINHYPELDAIVPKRGRSSSLFPAK